MITFAILKVNIREKYSCSFHKERTTDAFPNEANFLKY